MRIYLHDICMCIYSERNNEIWARYIHYISCICASRNVELGPIASLLPLFLSPCVTGMCSDLIRTTLGLPLRAGRCEIMHLVCRRQVRRSKCLSDMHRLPSGKVWGILRCGQGHAYTLMYMCALHLATWMYHSLSLWFYMRAHATCDSSSAHMCLCACARRYQSEGNSLHTGRRSRREQEDLDERLRICVTNNEI